MQINENAFNDLVQSVWPLRVNAPFEGFAAARDGRGLVGLVCVDCGDLGKLRVVERSREALLGGNILSICGSSGSIQHLGRMIAEHALGRHPIPTAVVPFLPMLYQVGNDLPHLSPL